MGEKARSARRVREKNKGEKMRNGETPRVAKNGQYHNSKQRARHRTSDNATTQQTFKVCEETIKTAVITHVKSPPASSHAHRHTYPTSGSAALSHEPLRRSIHRARFQHTADPASRRWLAAHTPAQTPHQLRRSLSTSWPKWELAEQMIACSRGWMTRAWT
jgi:hypothetical protein